jgi:signal transduction histidine kinase
MLDRLTQSRDRHRTFVADVAHELRSPLASMRTQLEISQRLDASEALVDDLHADVLRMGALVEDLLTLARLDADQAPSPAAAADVADVLAELRRRYADRRVPVRIGDAGPARVAADHDELVRVLGNLVDNAVRHAATRVEVGVVDRGGEIVLRVDDDGPGIAPADRERVFERFARLDEARDRDTGGSGLGLAIVAAVVQRRNGRTRLTDSPTGGLRVEVLLPAAG